MEFQHTCKVNSMLGGLTSKFYNFIFENLILRKLIDIITSYIILLFHIRDFVRILFHQITLFCTFVLSAGKKPVQETINSEQC